MLIQGLIYPPNNCDSMTAYLARTIHWISHGSVEYYTTNNLQQLYHPPLPQYIIMHFNILSSGDYFANIVQFFFLIFSLFGLISINRELGISVNFDMLSIFIAITIPMVILEASSTMTDIVVSFFVITSIYYAIRAVKNSTWQNFLLLGLSSGLGCLSKATSYIYIGTVLIIFAIGILFKLLKTKQYSIVGYSFLALVVFIGINSGHYYRNYKLTQNLLGTEKQESHLYLNEKMSPKLLVSNIMKNVGLHIYPATFNNLYNRLIYKVHYEMGQPIANKETNYYKNLNYVGKIKAISFNNENFAPNPLHFALIVIAFISVIFLGRKQIGYNKIVLYALMIVLQALFFCFVLKWQMFHSRLHTPLFLVSIPLIGYCYYLKPFYRKLLNVMISFIFIYSLSVILFNCYRPYIRMSDLTTQVSIFDNRFKKYLLSDDANNDYISVIEEIKEKNYRNIGLILRYESYEYPLFVEFYGKDIHPVHLNVSNISKSLPPSKDNIDCIISNNINESKITYNGKIYHNDGLKNKTIWLYKLY